MTGSGWLRFMWRSGGRHERPTIALLVVGVSLMPVPFVLVGLLAVPSSVAMWHQLLLAMSIAVFSLPPFYPVIVDAMHSPSAYRALPERSSHASMLPAEREYLREWARFKESSGADEQLPDLSRFAHISLALYFGLFFLSAPYVILVYGTLGTWTFPSFAAFAVPSYIYMWLLIRRTSRTLHNEAAARGFRLDELRKQVIAQRGHSRIRLLSRI